MDNRLDAMRRCHPDSVTISRITGFITDGVILLGCDLSDHRRYIRVDPDTGLDHHRTAGSRSLVYLGRALFHLQTIRLQGKRGRVGASLRLDLAQ